MSTTQVEEWREVTGYEGVYEVSNLGRIRLYLSPYEAGGYRKVWLRTGGRSDERYLHTLIAEAFIGAKPKGRVVNHVNGVKVDNRAANLEYISKSEDTKHAYKLGLNHKRFGSNNCRTKYSDEMCLRAATMKSEGIRTATIAKVFGISWQAVGYILKRAGRLQGVNVV